MHLILLLEASLDAALVMAWMANCWKQNPQLINSGGEQFLHARCFVQILLEFFGISWTHADRVGYELDSCIDWTGLGYVDCQSFLADRTNGRAYATVLRLSVCRLLSVTLCIVAKRCILEQKLQLRAYRKSYMRNRLVPKWMTLTFV